MPVSRYLPSVQFVFIAGSLFLSAGLIYAAQWYTHSVTTAARLTSTQQQNALAQPDWERVLNDIQAQDPAYSLPEPPSEESLSALLNAAQSSNLTDTVGRTLLINLTAAKSQGLGGDIPTQEHIIAQATAQLPSGGTKNTYSSGDLTVVAAGTDTLHTYGNAVVSALIKYPDTEPQKTLVIIGMATDTGDSSYLEGLLVLQREYAKLTGELLSLPVPQTLVPLHLQLVNGFAYAGSLYPDLATVFTDPLRALSALQAFQTQSDEIGRVFTTIAQQLTNNAILFTKDEPGGAWSALISAP